MLWIYSLTKSKPSLVNFYITRDDKAHFKNGKPYKSAPQQTMNHLMGNVMELRIIYLPFHKPQVKILGSTMT
jgi:hypothetical protein